MNALKRALSMPKSSTDDSKDSKEGILQPPPKRKLRASPTGKVNVLLFTLYLHSNKLFFVILK